jgi:hypothetical protein
MRLPALISGVIAGRVVRYGVEAWLGARFGNDAAVMIREHYPMVGAVVAGSIVIYLVARRLARGPSCPDKQP